MEEKGTPVTRPLRRDEYLLLFATREAEKGWRDLVATARNAAVNAWDFLTAHPTPEHRLSASGICM